MLHPNKKYYTQSADQEDLISIGTIGLIKGISTFDASKGARLATYAARCVENEILMYFRSQRKGAQDVSLSDCIETGRDGSALSLMDTICSEEDLFEDLSTRELHGQLRAVMEQVLTPREKAIVSLRYGLSGGAPLTQREIAEQCGISRSYVSRIEKKALRAIREALDGRMRRLRRGGPVLLLDEATSALDEETEKNMLANIKKREDLTCLIISHRPAARTIADKTVIIEKI